MSLLRYNWLRNRGYKTVSGHNYRDSDFGDEWVELVMQKGKRIKRTRLNNMSLRQVLISEAGQN
jgi:hypothetical protein